MGVPIYMSYDGEVEAADSHCIRCTCTSWAMRYTQVLVKGCAISTESRLAPFYRCNNARKNPFQPKTGAHTPRPRPATLTASEECSVSLRS